MQVLVFATEGPDPSGVAGSPFVAIPNSAVSVLPAHPHGRQWTYFATMAADDGMLCLARSLQPDLERKGHAIFDYANPVGLRGRRAADALLVDD
jgi:hypothetical protein